MEHNERNDPELHPENTVDQLEATALDEEAPESRELTEDEDETRGSVEPAFDQDLDVEDLPGAPGQGSSTTTEPSG